MPLCLRAGHWTRVATTLRPGGFPFGGAASGRHLGDSSKTEVRVSPAPVRGYRLRRSIAPPGQYVVECPEMATGRQRRWA